MPLYEEQDSFCEYKDGESADKVEASHQVNKLKIQLNLEQV
jgi:hypothetical protein